MQKYLNVLEEILFEHYIWITLNPLTAGAAYIQVFIFY